MQKKQIYTYAYQEDSESYTKRTEFGIQFGPSERNELVVRQTTITDTILSLRSRNAIEGGQEPPSVQKWFNDLNSVKNEDNQLEFDLDLNEGNILPEVDYDPEVDDFIETYSDIGNDLEFDVNEDNQLEFDLDYNYVNEIQEEFDYNDVDYYYDDNIDYYYDDNIDYDIDYYYNDYIDNIIDSYYDDYIDDLYYPYEDHDDYDYYYDD